MLSENPHDLHFDGQIRSLRAMMVDRIGRRTVGEEHCSTAITNLILFRRESVSPPCSCEIEPSVVLVVQGAKQLLIGETTYAYDAERFLINSLDLPANSQVLEASPDKPCLGLGLKLDLRIMAELIAQGNLQPPRQRAPDGSSALGAVTASLLDPFARLIALLDDPKAIPVLAPLIEREIHYRLLSSEHGARIWQIASVGSQSHRIAKAIEWLRSNYSSPIRVDELAAHVQMSTSNLHNHFRQLTAMSPLQYLKWLRLHEARHLMMNQRLSAAGAAFAVGYESTSQFSREYGRLFGAPPKRDIAALRLQADRTAF